ncbi:MAG: adenylate/guanylate cyclase domain-containing protein [Giesbergeria sp.]|nr:adenylate/guanylate cyclase domain-containing protein [Giesbergeria sp.]MBP6158807.1 adenylate/guanylate cyclase domain-containing protein [Giesbergeria sp.]MBP7082328.1 adenylate/guanylate cyclase domain-containing protein [Giesbergeria sp.]MBP9783107.1 adenylate/guanylate cyclase domain-containing protein [Giesbergeria sp.]MBP9893940.1 adenylate/guanylate cyclase domain-containing protein [Giesbergeria sp.]
MRIFATVVFSDLSGSTALYESLGNERASQAVTRLTRWMGDVVVGHGGRVVKELGDGVLSVFTDAHAAVHAAADLQRDHQLTLARWAEPMRMAIRIGVATGEVVELEGDTYGDAVNVASRLCERAGASEIWVTDATAVDAGVVPRVHFRRLGMFDIRGKSESQVVYQADWRDDQPQEALTQHALLPSVLAPLDNVLGTVELAWTDEKRVFNSDEVPVHVGRSPEADCFVHDPRVSRMHARIDWRQGVFTLTDLSSFGSWVRFDGSDAEVRLRRDACILHGSGTISLGIAFGPGAPVLKFHVTGSSMKLS